MTLFRQKIVVLLLLCLVRGASAQRQDDIDLPIAPLSPSPAFGMTNIYRLKNPQLQVTVVPQVGRIVDIRFGAFTNMFRMDEGLINTAATPPTPGQWRNFGGDWLWPVAQKRWPDFFERNWPPPSLIDDRLWTATAWRNADGSQSCLLTLDVEDPLNIRVTRLIQVEAETPRVMVRQRIKRTASSSIPVTLWNVSQVPGVEHVVLPIEPDSRFDGGFAVLDFAKPPDDITTRCESSVVFHVSAGTEHKVGSDSPRGWIAAQRGEMILVEQVQDHNAKGNFPDGGCRVEMYSNAGLGYTEIETLSVERNLRPGESIENTLYITCHRAPTNATPCELSDIVRRLTGEVAPATAP